MYLWEANPAQLADAWKLICNYYTAARSVGGPVRWVVDRARQIFDEIHYRMKWEEGGITSFDFATGLSEVQKELLTLVEGYDKLVAWEKEDDRTYYAWKIVDVISELSSSIIKSQDGKAERPFAIPGEDEEDQLLEKIKQRKDVNPVAGKKKYGDVEFADSKNNKYPIDTEAHIRAAWNYINKSGNAAKYDASDVKTIKSKIVAAWKKKIDAKGPPGAKKSAMPDGSRISKIDATQQKLYAVVLEPDTPDADGQTFTKEFIEDACHRYGEFCQQVYKDHKDPIPATVIENYIAQTDFQYPDSTEVVKAGSWVVALKINNAELWEQVKKGDFTGVSIRGYMVKKEADK